MQRVLVVLGACLMLFPACQSKRSTEPHSPADTTPPTAVRDLAVQGPAGSTVTLSWTSPGDDGGNGVASRYDMRYAAAALTEERWDSARVIPSPPPPRAAGRTELFTITGLPAGAWCFALKTADEVPNWSTLSNSASAVVMPLAPRRLTTSPSTAMGAMYPAWSPGGQRIAFSADWTALSRSSIYSMPSSGGEATRLTDEPAGFDFDDAPSCSPDGSRIVYRATRGDKQGLWVVGTEPGSRPVLLVNPDSGRVADPAWSPDGTRIAYAVMYPSTPDTLWREEIYIIPATGGTPQRLLHWGAACTDPAWSPDGTRLAFSSNRSGNTEIWVAAADGSDPVQLTHNPLSSNADPSWSPDGSRVAFQSDRTGSLGIWLMSSAGESQVQLTATPHYDGSPCWSPDGDQIAFSSDRSGRYEIWILRLN